MPFFRKSKSTYVILRNCIGKIKGGGHVVLAIPRNDQTQWIMKSILTRILQ